MDETARSGAERHLERALESAAVEDPRPRFRERLRWLRERTPAGFEHARQYYTATLLPRMAAASDVLDAWVDYGRLLGDLTAPGRVVQIGPGGEAEPYRSPVVPELLVLHLPDDGRSPALGLSVPSDATPAQRATYELLVLGRLGLT